VVGEPKHQFLTLKAEANQKKSNKTTNKIKTQKNTLLLENTQYLINLSHMTLIK
jgi:hypothetical protein